MILRFVFISILLYGFSSQQIVSKSESCFLRCVAACVAFVKKSEQNVIMNVSYTECEKQCISYNDTNLCQNDSCWSTCNGRMEEERTLPAPTNLTYHGQKEAVWEHVPGAVLYYVAYRPVGQTTYHSNDNVVVFTTHVVLADQPDINPCGEYDIEVAALSEDGVGLESRELRIPVPKPTANPKMDLKSLTYLNQPLISDFYQANATVSVVFDYHTDEWLLGDDDLEVQPLFHLISCVDPDLSQGIPVPDFEINSKNGSIQTAIGSDMMERKCRYVYYLQSVKSKQCGTTTEMPSPPSSALQTVQIECDIVKNAPCVKVPVYQNPICGQVDNLTYSVYPNPSHANLGDPNSNVTINITFTPVVRDKEPPTLYYVGIYGEASNYNTKEEEAFLGVNITRVLGEETSCEQMIEPGKCLKQYQNNSILLHGIHPQKMYGLTICAIKDARNLTLPDLSKSSKSVRPKAFKILLQDKSGGSSAGLIVGAVLGGIAVAVILVSIVLYYFRNKHRKQEKLYKLKIAQIEKDNHNRYIDFPIQIKHDIWEIERRNLIIHNDKKLGSGAFGAVYLGRLIGKSLAHKDANSPLGINLMRAENCEVAVKMLPEYADDMSKSEFLREIGLMKTLGYHERLVNMLACVTDSEPLCLVVEYCSDGDLLQYLRLRCKYMMKLDDLGINYHDPPVNNNYDPNMIITIKQLLQFAVQISYGLEYLSQKGFVHRDVAARNVLVHEGNACKIGDFGLCRYIYADQNQYKSKGGRLPLKWMSPEAIRHYEFSIKSDVWSFGILLFEIITLGGSPYPGMPPEDVLPFLENGGRIEQPDNCPDNFYEVMQDCWDSNPEHRIEFSDVRMKLATQLEDITEDYSYLKLDADKDYYNVQYGEKKKEDIIIIPDGVSKTIARKQSIIGANLEKSITIDEDNDKLE